MNIKTYIVMINFNRNSVSHVRKGFSESMFDGIPKPELWQDQKGKVEVSTFHMPN